MHFIYFMYFCIQKGKKDLYMAAKINQEKGKVIEVSMGHFISRTFGSS